MMTSQTLKFSLYFIFAISGFAGLIYESIWTHYLKLVLGHAAHAQTLVLTLFMGGMAIGAWFISKKSKKIRNPILVYAAIELIIGMFALTFHQAFLQSQSFLFSEILPNVQSANTATIIRWLWASLLILPQSILLGSTFPLMSAGIVRLFPRQTGSILSMLYFTNSIGAAIGVLFSGFILIDAVGLPGTILTAGLLNIFLAIFVWALTKNKQISAPCIQQPTKDIDKSYPFSRFLLLASLLTGLASFFYEIAWIRMLNLVLGSTTQSFELMISAFITGIAFGGLWIKKYIDSIKNIVNFAGYVQIIMGIMALSTLLLYNSTFDFMTLLMKALQRNEEGYMLFISSSHLIAFVIMVPTTFMAGMTLPLFTYSYMKAGYGEKGIGRIYAVNTLGSIIGVFLAVHFIMPLLGLKNLVSLGALVDILLGLTLIYLSNQKTMTVKLKTAVVSSLAIFLLINVIAEFDKGKMASGIYRNGTKGVDNNEIIFNTDGKTSTVVVQRTEDKDEKLKKLTIRTNGKPDAGVIFDPIKYTNDEPTMVLMATYPLAVHPEAKTAAVIGMGSGISTNTLLETNKLQSVDTIEIEQAMVEGARYFEHFSERVFDDPRSHIHIDDAKSFFSVNNKKYDIILSEPSNPWVSGVASLFTQEFYQQLKPHLNQGGVFAQWLQIYEIDMNLVASVFKALNNEFKYYVAYQTVNVDVVILASDDDRILRFNPWVFQQQPLTKTLKRLHITNTNDLYARRIGTKTTLEPFFNNTYPDIQANSDFFPTLNRRAPKARFMNLNSLAFTNLPYQFLPVMDIIDPFPINSSRHNTTVSEKFKISLEEQSANVLLQHLLNNKPIIDDKIPDKTKLALIDIQNFTSHCQLTGSFPKSLITLAEPINIFLPPLKSNLFWDYILDSPCIENISSETRNWIKIFKSVGQKNAHSITQNINALLSEKSTDLEMSNEYATYLYTSGLAAYIALQKIGVAKDFSKNAPDIFGDQESLPLNLRLLQGIINKK